MFARPFSFPLSTSRALLPSPPGQCQSCTRNAHTTATNPPTTVCAHDEPTRHVDSYDGPVRVLVCHNFRPANPGENYSTTLQASRGAAHHQQHGTFELPAEAREPGRAREQVLL